MQVQMIAAIEMKAKGWLAFADPVKSVLYLTYLTQSMLR